MNQDEIAEHDRLAGLCNERIVRIAQLERELAEERERREKAERLLASECQTCDGTGIMFVSDDGEGKNETAVECGECGATGRGHIAQWKGDHRKHLALTRRRALLLGEDRRRLQRAAILLLRRLGVWRHACLAACRRKQDWKLAAEQNEAAYRQSEAERDRLREALLALADEAFRWVAIARHWLPPAPR